VETRFVEVQCDIECEKRKTMFFEDSEVLQNNEDMDNTGLVVINNNQSSIIYDNDNIVDYARQNQYNNAATGNGEVTNKAYIEQLKNNYEAEMELQ
jgi:hypothetical protein